ncbi:MAG: hypothetical protein JNK64_40115 [Myxococcales bacterium]|nr:hypothetical protein [Myxococcales bacterium]
MRPGTIVAASLVWLAACGRDRDDPGAAVPPTIRRIAPDAGSPATPSASPPEDPGTVAGPGPAGGADVMAASDPSLITCPDPLAGVWIAKTHAATTGRWHEHRLSITRQGHDYRATQTTHMWFGGTDDPFPPSCPSGGQRWTAVDMTDEVELLEGIVHVWGTAITSNVTRCGDEPVPYNLDSFTGALRRNTFDALNNDEHDAQNRPYRFRRIACAP